MSSPYLSICDVEIDRRAGAEQVDNGGKLFNGDIDAHIQLGAAVFKTRAGKFAMIPTSLLYLSTTRNHYMTKLLFIEASPPVRESESVRIAEAYLNELRNHDASLIVDRINVWDEDLPRLIPCAWRQN